MAVSEKKKASDYKWAKENMTIVGVRVRNTLKEEFRTVCEHNGTTMNAVLLKALHDYMDGADQVSPSPLPLPAGWTQGKPSVLRTFHAAGGWQLDIEEQGTHYGAWLSNIGSDQKQYLVGADKSKHTLDEFISLVLDNIAEYQHDYANEFLGE